MSKEKLVTIIVPCVIAIIVVIVITTRSPQNTKKPEQIAVSAYNLSEQLFDPELTSLQRDALWKEYDGKQVKWTSELREVASGKEGAVAYFLNPSDWGRTEVRAVFDKSQTSSLLQCKQGDLVTYTGILTSLGEDEISLTGCAFVSLAIAPLWWNKDIDTYSKRILVGDEVLCLGPSTYYSATGYNLPTITAINRETGESLWEGKKTKSVLMGIDSHYIYTCVLALSPIGMPVHDWSVRPDIEALNETSGHIAWTSSLSTASFSDSDSVGCSLRCFFESGEPPSGDFLADYLDCCVLRWGPQSVREEIIDNAESGLILLTDKPSLSELTYEYEGVIYESDNATYGVLTEGRHALQAIDPRTDDVLWTATFEYTGMTDFSIVDGILFVSTDNGVGAFELPNVTDSQNPKG